MQEPKLIYSRRNPYEHYAQHGFYFCKKGKRRYSLDTPQDYAAKRDAEVRQNRFVTVPKSVLIRETVLGGVPVELLSHPRNPTDRIVLYLHGGGFVVGSVKPRRMFTAHIANQLGYNVAAPEYRLAPEYPFPAAPEDCFAVYRELVKNYPSNHIVLLGESAGGNLVLSVLLQIKAAGLPMPAAALCIAPCVQYDQTLPSYIRNRDTEAMVDNLSEEVFDTYLCSREPGVIRNPLERLLKENQALTLYRNFRVSSEIQKLLLFVLNDLNSGNLIGEVPHPLRR